MEGVIVLAIIIFVLVLIESILNQYGAYVLLGIVIWIIWKINSKIKRKKQEELHAQKAQERYRKELLRKERVEEMIREEELLSELLK